MLSLETLETFLVLNDIFSLINLYIGSRLVETFLRDFLISQIEVLY